MLIEIPDNIFKTFFNTYHSGNSWGCDNKRCGIGFGPQEQFINCADVSILKQVKIIQRDSSEESTEESDSSESEISEEKNSVDFRDDMKSKLKSGARSALNVVKEKTKQVNCQPSERWRTVPGMTTWCLETCPKCPSSHCICK